MDEHDHKYNIGYLIRFRSAVNDSEKKFEKRNRKKIIDGVYQRRQTVVFFAEFNLSDKALILPRQAAAKCKTCLILDRVLVWLPLHDRPINVTDLYRKEIKWRQSSVQTSSAEDRDWWGVQSRRGVLRQLRLI